MHIKSGVRDPAISFLLPNAIDDRDERRRANRAVVIGALGLALTGVLELAVALVSGSAALLGDALHNLADVTTSVVVFVGFWGSRGLASPRYPYGRERTEDLAGIGVALVIWVSAVFAGWESVEKLVRHSPLTTWVGVSRRRPWASSATNWSRATSWWSDAASSHPR